jgi:zinc protease
MKKHFIKALVLLAVLPLTVGAQTAKLVEKVTKTPGKLVIPYEKYVLPNGLTIIVHEDHSDPIVHVDVTYHVGSNRESIGRSGFAHFFEHMMFQGSDNVADEQHIKTVSAAGGSMNGTTNSDRTNYFETVPSNQLAKMLWLEADRMGFLLDAVTQKKFEVQRSTVKNERGQNYDNRPYGLIYEKTASALYPFGHPYSWSTIGTLADLDRVDVTDLKSFFLRWYGPNNAVLTVAGDVTPAEVVKLAEKYFGPIPKGPEVTNMPKQLVTLDKDRYISYEDNVRFPMIKMSYPSVHNYHADEAPLDVLADILGGGSNTSIFYKNFEKPGLAIQANVSNPCSELSGMFTITVLPMPGGTLADMEKLIRSSFDEFEKRGVTEDDLKKYKAKFEADAIGSLSSVSGKGSMLASYQTFTGNPNYSQVQLDAYMNVTKEDVMRVYNKYIKNQHAVILSVYPKGKPELKAADDNFTPPETPADFKPDLSQYQGLTYVKAKDTFDRKKEPAAGANPVVKVPAIYKENLPNGLRVIGTKSDELPMVTVQINVKAGQVMEDMKKAGTSSLLADMLNESTKNFSSESISEEVEKLGSEISIDAGPENITITVSSLTKNLDATLKLVEEKMFAPKFDTADFNRVKKQHLEYIANQATSATTIANNIYGSILYGPNNIFSLPIIGTAESVESITIDDVKSFYNKFFAPDFTQMIVVGNVGKDEILSKTKFLANWKKYDVVLPAQKPTPKIEKTKIYFVNKDKAPQSEIRIGYIGLPYDATGDYYKAGIVNFTLGGAFNSRINLNLREDKGWTYGARTGFRGSRYAGPFTASAGVKGNATDSSVVEFIKEIKLFADNGITPEELTFTKSSMGQADALKYETPGQKAGFLARMLEYNLDPNYVDAQTKILTNITKADIDALAKKYLPYDKMVIVVVGDKAKVFDQLTKLGYEVEQMDVNGVPFK